MKKYVKEKREEAKEAEKEIGGSNRGGDNKSRSAATASTAKSWTRWIIVAFIVFWFLNSFVLQKFYNVSDYYGWVEFVNIRWIVYEFMFLMLTVSLFFRGAQFEKALLCFISMLIVGSIAEKLFGLHSYMYSDLVLIVLSLIVSFIVWKKFRKK